GWVIEYRHLFLRQFDKQVVQHCTTHYEALNQWFIKQGILPNLRYIPLRQRGASRPVHGSGAADAGPSARAEGDWAAKPLDEGIPGFEQVEQLGASPAGGAAPQRASYQPSGPAEP